MPAIAKITKTKSFTIFGFVRNKLHIHGICDNLFEFTKCNIASNSQMTRFTIFKDFIENAGLHSAISSLIVDFVYFNIFSFCFFIFAFYET